MPIAGAFSELKELFVDVIRVSKVDDVFMMKELAKAANKPSKSSEAIRELMLETAAMLDDEYHHDRYAPSLEVLKQASFLPCRGVGGVSRLLTPSEPFYINDNAAIGDAFGDQVAMLDFTYQEFNTLHRLLRVLDLSDRYISSCVRAETTEGYAVADADLTSNFRQCAYALSCCAILHRSSYYLGQTEDMHIRLLHTSVYTSADIFDVYCLKQGTDEIKVPTNKAFLLMSREDQAFRIVVPKAQDERKSCFRSQLPRKLATELGIWDASAEKQLYRIINEVDMGTDQLMEEESIPPASWLQKTERPMPIVRTPVRSSSILTPQGSTPEGHRIEHGGLTNLFDGLRIVDVNEETGVHSPAQYIANYRPNRQYITIPATISVETVPEHYSKVLKHVHRQAVGVKWRHGTVNSTMSTTSDLTNHFATLEIHGDPLEASSRPQLFGADNYSNFRLGAAGELFVSITPGGNGITLTTSVGFRSPQELDMHS